MPKSRTRVRTRVRKTALDRRLRAEARAAAFARLNGWGRVKKHLGWPLCTLGAVLFVATFIANFAGTVILPFDQHHLFGQVGGVLLIVTGLTWATL